MKILINEEIVHPNMPDVDVFGIISEMVVERGVNNDNNRFNIVENAMPATIEEQLAEIKDHPAFIAMQAEGLRIQAQRDAAEAKAAEWEGLAHQAVDEANELRRIVGIAQALNHDHGIEVQFLRAKIETLEASNKTLTHENDVLRNDAVLAGGEFIEFVNDFLAPFRAIRLWLRRCFGSKSQIVIIGR